MKKLKNDVKYLSRLMMMYDITTRFTDNGMVIDDQTVSILQNEFRVFSEQLGRDIETVAKSLGIDYKSLFQ